MASFHTSTLILLACNILFLVQLILIWIDYSQGRIGVDKSHQEIPPDQKSLPCLTFCPLPAFKTENYSQLQLMTSPEYFLNATYGTDDIFSDDMVQGLYYIARKH